MDAKKTVMPAKGPFMHEKRCCALRGGERGMYCSGEEDHQGPHFDGSRNLPRWWSDKPLEDLRWVAEYMHALASKAPGQTKSADRKALAADLHEAAQILAVLTNQIAHGFYAEKKGA